jgi:hypothetical protein
VCDEHVRVESDQLGGERGKALLAALRPTVFDHDVPTFVVPQVTEALQEGVEVSRVVCGGQHPEEADSVDLPCLLRLGGERRGEETARQGADEGPPVHHSIT